MAGAELIGDLAVILRTLIGVLDHQSNGRTRRLAFEYAGKNPDLIRFTSLRGVARSTGLATVKVDLAKE
jgi:hypothetical protein